MQQLYVINGINTALSDTPPLIYKYCYTYRNVGWSLGWFEECTSKSIIQLTVILVKYWQFLILRVDYMLLRLVIDGSSVLMDDLDSTIVILVD